jgi:phage terminase large subunit-like protein
VDVLDTATGARRQPLIFEITTAGWDRLSVCWQHHEYSRQVVEGLVEDDTWFAYVAGADPGDDWQDEATWAKANPNLGISVKADDLRAKARRARQVPDEQNAFKRLHLNIWTEQAERWLDLEDWQASAGAVPHDELPARLAGRRCYAGLDLSSTEDVAALVLVFPDDEEPEGYDVLCRFWIPEATARRRTEKGAVPYSRWVDEGLIDATEGNVVDYDAIEAAIVGLADVYEIVELAYDPWNALSLITRLQARGMEVIPIRQGYASLSAPTKHLQSLVLSRRLRHGANPVLTWMAGNMAVVSDPAGNIKPAKDKSSEKIDGMAALINAVARLIVQAAPAESVYERVGLFLPWGEDADAEAAG